MFTHQVLHFYHYKVYAEVLSHKLWNTWRTTSLREKEFYQYKGILH